MTATAEIRDRIETKWKKRKDTRRGILANFQLYINDNSKEFFKGITTDISPDGFGFLTETVVKEGQTVTISKHALKELIAKKAKVIWAKKGSRYVEAGTKFS